MIHVVPAVAGATLWGGLFVSGSLAWISDRGRQRGPWVYAGGLIAAIAGAALYGLEPSRTTAGIGLACFTVFIIFSNWRLKRSIKIQGIALGCLIHAALVVESSGWIAAIGGLIAFLSSYWIHGQFIHAKELEERWVGDRGDNAVGAKIALLAAVLGFGVVAIANKLVGLLTGADATTTSLASVSALGVFMIIAPGVLAFLAHCSRLRWFALTAVSVLHGSSVVLWAMFAAHFSLIGWAVLGCMLFVGLAVVDSAWSNWFELTRHSSSFHHLVIALSGCSHFVASLAWVYSDSTASMDSVTLLTFLAGLVFCFSILLIGSLLRRERGRGDITLHSGTYNVFHDAIYIFGAASIGIGAPLGWVTILEAQPVDSGSIAERAAIFAPVAVVILIVAWGFSVEHTARAQESLSHRHGMPQGAEFYHRRIKRRLKRQFVLLGALTIIGWISLSLLLWQ